MILRWLVICFSCLAGNAQAQFCAYIPQVVDGENAPDDREHFFATEFTFINLSATESVDGVLTLTADDGSGFPRLGGGIHGGFGGRFTLPPLGSQTFRTSNGPFRIVGWGKVESTGELGISVTLQYLVSVTGDVVTSTSIIPSGMQDSFAISALISAGRGTGVALLNPSETEAAEIEIGLFDADGVLVAERTIELGPFGKIAQFLDEGELFPSLTLFFGTAEVSSSLPLAVTTIRVDDTYWSAMPVFPARIDF